jgi:hypothetical protein
MREWQELFYVVPGGVDFGCAFLEREQERVLIRRNGKDVDAGCVVDGIGDGGGGVDGGYLPYPLRAVGSSLSINSVTYQRGLDFLLLAGTTDEVLFLGRLFGDGHRVAFGCKVVLQYGVVFIRNNRVTGTGESPLRRRAYPP